LTKDICAAITEACSQKAMMDKVKGVRSFLRETHHRATDLHLPYWITQCYLLPDTYMKMYINKNYGKM